MQNGELFLSFLFSLFFFKFLLIETLFLELELILNSQFSILNSINGNFKIKQCQVTTLADQS